MSTLFDDHSTETANATVVSSEREELILVDADDEVVGYRSKGDCHDGEGILHRAFSVFLFDNQGHVLIQQRSADKRLWPLYWSNSVCSHPRRGESLDYATGRRMKEELGCRSALEPVYKFQYQARYSELGSENELCSVYLGRVESELAINPTEIADWRFVSPDDLERELAETPDQFTPWFKMEWGQLQSRYTSQLEAYTCPAL